MFRPQQRLVLRHDAAPAVQEPCGRQGIEAAVEPGDAAVPQQVRIADPVLRQKRRDRPPPLRVHRDADNRQPPVAMPLVDGVEPGHLDAARWTPRRPEVQHNHLAPEIGQAAHLAGRVLRAELRRGGAGLRQDRRDEEQEAFTHS
ncbi:MAG: hypothetical protein IPM24_08810 [Bryobacterales bacterium]|nr:hypothetical protein [Bryobacterales bacterium]